MYILARYKPVIKSMQSWPIPNFQFTVPRMCWWCLGPGSHSHLVRTTSDSRMVGDRAASGKRSPSHKNSVTKAWLQFQADIEAALFRKPSSNGMYKNLSDMLHSRMDQLEQVGPGSLTEIGKPLFCWKCIFLHFAQQYSVLLQSRVTGVGAVFV